MTFQILFLIIMCGLVGPLLAGIKRLNIPLVVGEIAAGIIVGHSGLGILNPAEPTLAFLSMVGFAMLMFLVGTHLPLHDPNLRKALGRGFLATALGFAFAVPAGLAVAAISGIAHPAIFVLLFANCSAAVVMPIVHERKLDGQTVLLTTTWVALADAVTIVALPLAMSSGKTLTIALGAGITTAVGVGGYFALSWFRNSKVGDYYRELSKTRGWALDLRLSLGLLFGLCALATSFGTSDLVAGFVAGAVVMLVGEPKRFTKQLVGVAEGLFVPLFFVLLGAKLDISALVTSPSNLELTGLIAVATVICHTIVAKCVKLPLVSGLTASAQLGLPAAVTSLGMSTGLLAPGQGAAIIAAALISLIACAAGTTGLAKYSTAPVDGASPPKPPAGGETM